MRWLIKLALGLLTIALLAAIILGMGSVALKALRAYRGETGTHDPMFAEEAVQTTRMPEISEDARTFEDHSDEWDDSVQTPVDQTADELGEEARRQSQAP